MATGLELLAARLARMKTLLDALEPACATAIWSREQYLKLQAELTAARATLNALFPPDQSPGESS